MFDVSQLRTALACAALGLGSLYGVPVAAQDGQPQKTAVEPLVEADWLLENLDDPGVVVLHVGGPPELFAEEHIPGAQPLSIGDVAWDGARGWAVEFRDREEILEAFRSRGIGQDSRVVIYGPSMTSTARAWVTFDYLGLGDHAFVLNGGMEAWKDAGGAVEDGEADARPAGDLVAEGPVDFRVTADWIQGRLEDESVALLDARPDDEYTGDDGGMGGMANPGHIPGAAQLYWEELMTEENRFRFRSASELEDILLRHGSGPDKTSVSYCMVGLRASVDYMAARMLGWDVLFYDGSWHDWGSRDDLPAVTGPDVPR